MNEKPKRKWRWVSKKHWDRIQDRSPGQQLAYWIEHKKIWKPVLKEKQALLDARTTIHNKREAAYVKVLAPQLVYLIANHFDHPYLSELIRIASVYSLRPAGYRRTDYITREGIPTKRGLKKADSLNALPRMVIAIRDEMAEGGNLTMASVYTVLRQLVHHEDPEIQMKAISKIMEYAVPKFTFNKNYNENQNLDINAWFSADMLNNPPPMKLDDDETMLPDNS